MRALAFLLLIGCDSPEPRVPTTGSTGRVEIKIASNMTREWAGVDRLIVRVDAVLARFEGYGMIPISTERRRVDLLAVRSRASAWTWSRCPRRA